MTGSEFGAGKDLTRAVLKRQELLVLEHSLLHMKYSWKTGTVFNTIPCVEGWQEPTNSAGKMIETMTITRKVVWYLLLNFTQNSYLAFANDSYPRITVVTSGTDFIPKPFLSP